MPRRKSRATELDLVQCPAKSSSKLITFHPTAVPLEGPVLLTAAPMLRLSWPPHKVLPTPAMRRCGWHPPLFQPK